ncbi:hypothetical protein LXL04_024912 [Taraxacum kok-saghyz]
MYISPGKDERLTDFADNVEIHFEMRKKVEILLAARDLLLHSDFNLPKRGSIAWETDGAREGRVCSSTVTMAMTEPQTTTFSGRFLPFSSRSISERECLRGKERLVGSHRVLVGAVLCSCVKKVKPVRSSGDCRNFPAAAFELFRLVWVRSGGTSSAASTETQTAVRIFRYQQRERQGVTAHIDALLDLTSMFTFD